MITINLYSEGLGFPCLYYSRVLSLGTKVTENIKITFKMTQSKSLSCSPLITTTVIDSRVESAN